MVNSNTNCLSDKDEHKMEMKLSCDLYLKVLFITKVILVRIQSFGIFFILCFIQDVVDSFTCAI